jgi:hypothetical protein
VQSLRTVCTSAHCAIAAEALDLRVSSAALQTGPVAQKTPFAASAGDGDDGSARRRRVIESDVVSRAVRCVFPALRCFCFGEAQFLAGACCAVCMQALTSAV